MNVWFDVDTHKDLGRIKLEHDIDMREIAYIAIRKFLDEYMKDGKLNAYWVQCTNNMQTAPNMNEEGLPGYRNPANFIVVSDPYPTVTALAADLILPSAAS